MEKGDVLGHEFMGIVEDVGSEVKNVQKGDRVVTAFDIGCHKCDYCTGKQKLYSSCDNTNDSKQQEQLYGHRTSGKKQKTLIIKKNLFLILGMFGYSHVTGGWDGGQAQYVRVPFADTNTLKISSSLPDEKVLFLSDILPTGWHATELGEVSAGQTVAIWGCGPVGMLAALSAQYKKASRVILIDNVQYRLDFAKKHLPGVETINFFKRPTLEQLKELLPNGPDVGIEAVGCHYTKTASHKLETDPSEILNEMIMAVRKGGMISVIGIYVGTTNGFNIGAFMEKGMRMAAGQTPCQRYWSTLLPLIEKGELDPSFVITHTVPLEKAPDMYKMFNDKTDSCVKVVLKP
jgi:threonine dehydrogenase-like Zn-dependent dehydrogenase